MGWWKRRQEKKIEANTDNESPIDTMNNLVEQNNLQNQQPVIIPADQIDPAILKQIQEQEMQMQQRQLYQQQMQQQQMHQRQMQQQQQQQQQMQQKQMNNQQKKYH